MDHQAVPHPEGLTRIESHVESRKRLIATRGILIATHGRGSGDTGAN
jgi:hypothetical protein